jgi:hypothetical protein
MPLAQKGPNIDRRRPRWRRRRRSESPPQPPSSGLRAGAGKRAAPAPPLHEAIEKLEAGVGRLLLAVDEEGISSATAMEMVELLKTRLYDVQEGRRYVGEIRRAGEPGLWVVETVS